ncbi:TonB-dependent receptor [Larkinella ripae]
MNRWPGLVLILGLAVPGHLLAQAGDGFVKGLVLNADGKPNEHATIRLKDSRFGTASGSDGGFELKASAGSYTLVVSKVAHKTETIPVTVEEGKTTTLPVVVLTSDETLSEVLVIGKTETQAVREQSYAITAIDAKALYNANADMNQVLNRTAGIRVREEGGLGSSFNFSLNGFSGRQVKFFLDGIPMDNFGSSLSLNNLPINLAERIEVYKGVVPVWLGTDALGGAVNIVTNQTTRNFLDASYSYGSFNTHRTAFSAGYTSPRTGFRVQANLFHNYSDNNYRVTAPVLELASGQNLGERRVRRFHDTYQSAMVQLELGVVDKKFADRLLVGLIASGSEKDVQTGATIDNVYGKLFRTNRVFMPTLKYRKANLFTKGLDVNLYASYNAGREEIIDTVGRKYNWLGEYVVRSNAGGELNRSFFTFRDRVTLANANVSYTVSERQSLALNYVFTDFHRKGNDPLDPANELRNYPQQVAKNVLGLAWKFDYSERWTTTVFAKLYRMEAESYSIKDLFTENERIAKDRSAFVKPGFGLASTYFVLPTLQLKTSYERTYRLPEGSELFGDGLFIDPNVGLLPERSDNVNLGANYVLRKGADHRITAEANLIYRRANDYIRPQISGIKVQSVNLRDALTTGIDGDVHYYYKNRFSVGANVTYQNLINNTQYERGDSYVSYIYKDRLPNIPYFFGNADAGLAFRNVGAADATLAVNWNVNFVEAYYLKWPSLGSRDSKMVIPRQLSQNLSVSYGLKNGKYNLSAECRNLTDAELFDNYRLPKPGRAFYLKFRYFVSK